MVKFSHTIFALPFAGLAVLLALPETQYSGNELILRLVLVIVCMVSARNAAMGFNRAIDEDFDKLNPRTKNREIPSGIISKQSVYSFTILFSLIFILASYFISFKVFLLSFPALAIVLFYSYTKRITWLCHYVLGLGIGIAPTGAWLAILDSFSLIPVLWSFGLMFHISGFDILYATQDYEFDRSVGLQSIPAKFGVSTALWVARINHVISIILLSLGGYLADLTWIYYIFLCITGILFFIEHWMVKPNDLSKVPIAFFHINASISVLLFIGIFVDRYSIIIDTLGRKF
jgi:4-hydroxybenzoate polyprenyltransferase